MLSVKEEVLHAVSALPQTATYEDVMYQLYVLAKIAKGEEDVRQGRTITSERLKEKIKSW